MLRMETLRPEPQFRLSPFRALRLTDSHVGAPVAQRAFARPYRSVPGRLREWRRRQRLILEPAGAYYVHEYTSSGIAVRGIVGTLDVAEAGGVVFPHEQVHEPQVRQLASRMEEMALNPAPILLMHRGSSGVRELLDAETADAPDLVYTDRSDQLHRIWRIDTPEHLDVLHEELLGTRAVIADGHHRYAAALRLQTANPGSDWDRTLVMLIDQSDTPLQLCAIHRTVGRLALDDVAATATARGEAFTRHATSHAALADLDRAIVLHDGTSWATLRPRADPPLLVRWLHEELLPAMRTPPERVAFHHAATDALGRAGQGTMAMLLPAPSFDGVQTSARSGQLLPPKATSFQPKPHVGVLMRPVPDE